jgi:FkbM family methyltransferase
MMQKKAINGRWVIWTTDAIAEWDGLTGDPAVPNGWEHERLTAMQRRLKYGDVLFDIGTEHGALSAVIAREFVGPENMVLIEPSPEFWPNIRKHWVYNGLQEPMAFWPGFFSDETDANATKENLTWPKEAHLYAPETPGLAYRSLVSPGRIPSTTLDDFVRRLKVAPGALNIDVEGAELKIMRGAVKTLADFSLHHIWISIHPDLMERDFGYTKEDLLAFMDQQGWVGKYLATDHEEHWEFTRMPV